MAESQNQVQVDPQEEQLWQKTLKKQTIKAFENFQQKYPSGYHTEEANNAIIQLQEAIDWKDALKSKSAMKFRAYIENYPYSSNIDEATETFHALREAELWKDANIKKKIPYYKAYINEYPNGVHANDARLAMGKLVFQLEEKQAKLREKSKNLAKSHTHKPKVNNSVSKIDKEGEQLIWREAKRANFADTYQMFIDWYPDSKFAKKAQKAIDKLNGKKSRKGLKVVASILITLVVLTGVFLWQPWNPALSVHSSSFRKHFFEANATRKSQGIKASIPFYKIALIDKANGFIAFAIKDDNSAGKNSTQPETADQE